MSKKSRKNLVPLGGGLVLDIRTPTPAPEPIDKALAKVAEAATAAPAAKPATPAKPTKKGRTLALLQRPSGATLSDIERELGVSTKAAQSLIGDVRRMGHKVERTEGGSYRAAL